MTAIETILLFTVSETMSRACRIGTPAESSIASVLENLDSAVLWNNGPKTGARSFSRSRFVRPFSVFLYRRSRNRARKNIPITMYQYFFIASDIAMSDLVGSGSWPPSCP